MAESQYTAPATYTITFPSLSQAEVKVSVNGVELSTSNYSIAGYSTSGSGTVTITSTVETGDLVRIFRDTDITTPEATFAPGASIKANDLNQNNLQLRYKLEEKIDSSNIASQAIITDHIRDGAVTTDKIADGAITNPKLAVNSVGLSNMQDDSVGSSEIIDNSVTNDKLADDSVDTAQLVDGSVTEPKIANNAVTNSKIADNSISGVKITDGTLDLSKLVAGDIRTLTEQNASPDAVGSDDEIGTTAANDQRYDVIYQSGTPAGSDFTTGKLWYDHTNNQTLSIWNGTAWTTVNSNVPELSNDTSPQLGGDLNVGTFDIVSSNNNNIDITPNGTGEVVLSTASVSDLTSGRVVLAGSSGALEDDSDLTFDGTTLTTSNLTASGTVSLSGLSYPTTDGAEDQVITTDGNGTLSFVSVGVLQGTGIQNVVEDSTPQLGGDLDVNGNSIVSTFDGDIVIEPDGNGVVKIGDTSGGITSTYLEFSDNGIKAVGYGDLVLDADGGNGIDVKSQLTSVVNTNIEIYPRGSGNVDFNPAASGTTRLINVGDPVNAQDVATKNYVDTNNNPGISNVVEDTTPQLGGNLDVNGNSITSASNGNVVIDPDGTGIINLGSRVGINTTDPYESLCVRGTGDQINLDLNSTDTDAYSAITWNTSSSDLGDNQGCAIRGVRVGSGAEGELQFWTRDNSATIKKRMRITESGILSMDGTTNSKTQLTDSGYAEFNRTDDANYGYVRLNVSEAAMHISDGTSINIYVDYNGDIRTESGIVFQGNTPAASTRLDDYEEGTWTPTLFPGGGSFTPTYATQSGNYTKIGNRVICSGKIKLSNETGTGQHLFIGGLPFTPTAGYDSGVVGDAINFGSVRPTALLSNQSSNAFQLRAVDATQGAQNINVSHLTNTSEFEFSISYRVAS